MYYQGPVAWRINGELQRCKALEGRARKDIETLFRSINGLNVPKPFGIRTGQWEYPDGTIKVVAFQDMNGNRRVWCDVIVEPLATQTDVQAVTYLLDHGVTAWSATALEWPLRVGTTATLRSYLSEGTGIPGSDPPVSVPLWGLATVGGTGCAVAESGVIFSGAPSLAGGIYDSAVWAAPSAVLPSDSSLWGGLARRWRQAVLGAGRMPSAVLGMLGWSDAPEQIWCGRERVSDDEERYWLFRTTAEGCWAAPLAVPAILACPAWWAASVALTGADLDYADAWILGHASPVALPGGGYDVRQILTAEQLAPLYADGIAPFKWGWGGGSRWCLRGDPDEYEPAAATVSVGEIGENSTWHLESRVGTIEIAWGAGGPTATLTVQTRKSWTTAGTGDRIGRAGAADGCWELIPDTGAAATWTDSGPVAAYYLPGGVLDVWRWSGTTLGAAGGVGESVLFAQWYFSDYPGSTHRLVCAGGNPAEVSGMSGYSAGTIAGWTSDSGGGAVVQRSGGRDFLSLSGSITAGGERREYAFPSNPFGMKQCDGSTLLDYWWTPEERPGRESIGWQEDGTVTYCGHRSYERNVIEYVHLVLSDVPGIAWVLQTRTLGVGSYTEGCCGTRSGAVKLGGLKHGYEHHYVIDNVSEGGKWPGCVSSTVPDVGKTIQSGHVYCLGTTRPLSTEELAVVARTISGTTIVPCVDGGAPTWMSAGGLVTTVGHEDLDDLARPGGSVLCALGAV